MCYAYDHFWYLCCLSCFHKALPAAIGQACPCRSVPYAFLWEAANGQTYDLATGPATDGQTFCLLAANGQTYDSTNGPAANGQTFCLLAINGQTCDSTNGLAAAGQTSCVLANGPLVHGQVADE
mmetsp:Transcript_11946/g.25673  ORF Transcript_11946/g.25673 Transcript_11946/m.25673 type:complete len:124 (+) Transcript_11946:824-1195(+)